MLLLLRGCRTSRRPPHRRTRVSACTGNSLRKIRLCKEVRRNVRRPLPCALCVYICHRRVLLCGLLKVELWGPELLSLSVVFFFFSPLSITWSYLPVSLSFLSHARLSPVYHVDPLSRFTLRHTAPPPAPCLSLSSLSWTSYLRSLKSMSPPLSFVASSFTCSTDGTLALSLCDSHLFPSPPSCLM